MNPCVSSLFPVTTQVQGDTFAYERHLHGQGFRLVAGIDEAGRGPLAGPVVAACVVLSQNCEYQLFRDSKLLTAAQRNRLFESLQHNGALIGIGMADPREIETHNILQASLLAMQRALAECTAMNNAQPPQYLLVDGRTQIPVPVPQLTLIKGERKSASIAAASIIAKVTRDRLMAELHSDFPQYGFNCHQGYPTKAHRQALAAHGPCILHRRTFRGVAEFFQDASGALPKIAKKLW